MAREVSFLGRGWSFPPAFTHAGGDVATVAGAEDVHQSLQIILGTMPGERVMREAFGCNLSSQQFEEVDRSLLRSVERLISNAILNHEPRVQLDRVTVEPSADGHGSCVMIQVHYTVRATNSRFNLVFPFYLSETARNGP